VAKEPAGCLVFAALAPIPLSGGAVAALIFLSAAAGAEFVAADFRLFAL